MHELLLWGLPLIGAPLLALRLKMARHTVQQGSTGLALGDRLGHVGALPSITGLPVDVLRPGSRATVVVFMANRCPGVKAYDGRLRRLIRQHRGTASFVGINPIDEGHHPGEGLERMAAALAERGLPMLYLKDRDQAVARAYGAVCTPEVVVLDARRRIRYRGRIDDALVERDVRRHHLQDAIRALHRGKAPRVAQTSPLGCSIDPMAGNAIVLGAPA